MSLVKLATLQVGKSGTASNNFHWRNLLDGLLRLTRGNAGTPITDVMLVNADNSVGFPGGVSNGVLGAGQTWQNVTGSRAFGVTYTNSTGRPIFLSVTTYGGINSNITISINGSAGIPMGADAVNSGNANACGQMIVQAGATYTVSGVGLAGWWELR